MCKIYTTGMHKYIVERFKKVLWCMFYYGYSTLLSALGGLVFSSLMLWCIILNYPLHPCAFFLFTYVSVCFFSFFLVCLRSFIYRAKIIQKRYHISHCHEYNQEYNAKECLWKFIVMILIGCCCFHPQVFFLFFVSLILYGCSFSVTFIIK